MTVQQDSIYTTMSATTVSDTVVSTYTRPQTPYQVLRLLPKDATPAQQDSAIQAWLKPQEIRYSGQPDTLHLPGEGIPRDMTIAEVPLYYRENFFSKDSMYHEELKPGGSGVSGDPVPETLSNDNVVTSILIICFLFIAFTLSRISSFIVRQLKDFFYPQRADRDINETGNEVKFQIAFVGLSSLVYGLLYYLYVMAYVADTFTLSSEYAILIIFVAVFIVYFALRFTLYHGINLLFFDKKRNTKFLTSLLFITAIEGAIQFPNLLLLAYLHFSPIYAAIYCIIVLVLVKLLTFYRSYVIFFKQNAVFLQIILYFCALEMVPLLTLWGGLSVIVDIFKIKI